MNIKILEKIEGAKKASGLTVIIDVFRAFSLEAYLFARGAKEIYAVGSETTARLLKMKYDDYVLIGEREGKILPGFDYGNSPFQTKHVDFQGKTVIHTTSSGTQGIVNASGASEIITGSLVNARAISRYIKMKNPENVSLVAMGVGGIMPAAEDCLCASYIRALLQGFDYALDIEIDQLKDNWQSKKFFLPSMQDIFPEEDYWMCTKADIFDFILKVEAVKKDIFRVTRQDIAGY